MKKSLDPPKSRGRGKPFEKGNKIGAAGRAGKNPIIAVKRAECKEKIMDAIHKIIPMPVEEVEVLAEAKGVKSIDALMAAVMVKGINTGNPYHAQFFMTYTFGRPFEYDPTKDTEIEQTSKDVEGVPRDILVGIVRMLHEQRRASVPTSP